MSVREGSIIRSEEGDESMEIEYGREAPARHPRESLDSHLLGRRDDDMDIDLDVRSYRNREVSEHPFAADADLDLGLGAGLGDLDLGISFDGLPDEGERTPRLTPSRACEFHLVFDPILCLMIFY